MMKMDPMNFENSCEYNNHIRDAAHNVELMKKRFLDEAEKPGIPLRRPIQYLDYSSEVCGVYYEDSKYTEEGLLFVLQSFYYLKNADDALAWNAAVSEILRGGVADFHMDIDFVAVRNLFWLYTKRIKEFPDKELAYCEYVSWFDIWRSIADVELYYSNVFCDSDVFIPKTMDYFLKQIKRLDDELYSFERFRGETEWHFSSYVNKEYLLYNDDGVERLNEDFLVKLLDRCKYLIHELEYQKSRMCGLLDALTISVNNERDFLYERYKSSLCASLDSIGYAFPDSIDRLGELALRGIVDDIVMVKFDGRDKKFETNICLIEKLRSSLSDWLTTRADIVTEVINHSDCFGCQPVGLGRVMRHDFVVYYLENTVELYRVFISALSCVRGNKIKLPYLKSKTTPYADVRSEQLPQKEENSCSSYRSDFYFASESEDDGLAQAIAEERKRAKERQEASEKGVSVEVLRGLEEVLRMRRVEERLRYYSDLN